MRTLAVLTTTLLLALSGSSQAVCRFDSGKIFFGAETPMRGEADSGKPCGQSPREGPCDLPWRRLNRRRF